MKGKAHCTIYSLLALTYETTPLLTVYDLYCENQLYASGLTSLISTALLTLAIFLDKSATLIVP